MDGIKLLYQTFKFWYIDVFKDNYWEDKDFDSLFSKDVSFQTSAIKRHRVKIEEIINEFSGYKTHIVYDPKHCLGLVYCLINKQYVIVASFTILNKEYMDNDFPYIITIYTHNDNNDIITGFSYINEYYENNCHWNNYFELKHVVRDYPKMKELK